MLNLTPETHREKSHWQAVMVRASYRVLSPLFLSSACPPAPPPPTGCQLPASTANPGNVPLGKEHDAEAGMNLKRGQSLAVAFLLSPSIHLPLWVPSVALGNPFTQLYLWFG